MPIDIVSLEMNDVTGLVAAHQVVTIAPFFQTSRNAA